MKSQLRTFRYGEQISHMTAPRRVREVPLWSRQSCRQVALIMRPPHPGGGRCDRSSRARFSSATNHLVLGAWLSVLPRICAQSSVCNNDCPVGGGPGNRCQDGGLGAEFSACALYAPLDPTPGSIPLLPVLIASRPILFLLCSFCCMTRLTEAPIAMTVDLATRHRRHRRHRRRHHLSPQVCS